MNSDFKDLLQLLTEEQVEYLAYGGYAVRRAPYNMDFLTSVPELDFEDCRPD